MEWWRGVPFSLRYLRFRLTARSPYRIHSQLLYQVIEKMRDARKNPALREAYAAYLRAARRCRVRVGDTRGASPLPPSSVTFAEYVRRVCLRYPEWVVLYVLCECCSAPLTVELGTGAGTSTLALCLASQNRGGRLVSVDASSALHTTVSTLLKEVCPSSRVEFVCSDFWEFLAELTAGTSLRVFAFVDGSHTYSDTVAMVSQIVNWCLPESLIVVHDIHWSAGMERAWQELTALERVSLAVDMFYMGVLFVGFKIRKQVFRVNPWGPFRG